MVDQRQVKRLICVIVPRARTGAHAGLPVRGLGLHRDRERDGLPVARPAATGQPPSQHRLPILYIVSIAISSIGETWAYYYFMSAAESALLALIVWYA